MFKKEIVAGKGESMLINEYYEEEALEESSLEEISLEDAGEYQQF